MNAALVFALFELGPTWKTDGYSSEGGPKIRTEWRVAENLHVGLASRSFLTWNRYDNADEQTVMKYFHVHERLSVCGGYVLDDGRVLIGVYGLAGAQTSVGRFALSVEDVDTVDWVVSAAPQIYVNPAVRVRIAGGWGLGGHLVHPLLRRDQHYEWALSAVWAPGLSSISCRKMLARFDRLDQFLAQTAGENDDP